MTSGLKVLQNSIFFGGVREIIGDIMSEVIISVGEDDGRIQLINQEDLVAASNQILDEASNEGIKSISLSTAKNILFCGGESNALFQMNWPDPESVTKIYETPANILRITCGYFNGDSVAFLCQNDTIYVFDSESKTLSSEIHVETGVLWMSMNHTGEYLAYVTGDMTLIVLEIGENDVRECMRTQLMESKYSSEQLSNADERNNLDLPVIAASWGNPYYLLVGNDQEASFVKWFDIKQQQEMKVNIFDVTTPITHLSISNKLNVAVITIEKTLHTFQLPAYAGEECNVPVVLTHQLQSRMTCLNWLGKEIIFGDEDGEVYKLSMETPEKEDKEKEEGEDEEIDETTKNKNDFLSSDDDEEKEEKTPQQTKPKQATMEGFGSLKSTMKDTYITTKKVTKKAKSTAKQQKLDLSAVAAPKPKSSTNTTNSTFIAPNKRVADILSSSDDEVENPVPEQSAKKSFISDDEIENVSYTQQQKEFQQQEQKKKFDFLDSEDDEIAPPSAPKKNIPDFLDSDSDQSPVPPPSSVTDTSVLPPSSSDDESENKSKQKKLDFLDSDSDVPSVPPPSSVTDTSMLPPSSSDDDEAHSQQANSRANYVESFSTMFMPTATRKDQELNLSILCWNQYYCMVKGQDDVGVPFIKVYRQNNGLQLIEIDGAEAMESTIGCTSENSLLLVSSNSYYYRQFYISSEDDDDAHPEDDGETTYETHGSSENGESYTLCAVGKDWFALITNANRLYIYDKIGNIMDILTLESRPITMVGHEDFLLLVTGGFHKFEIFDIANTTIIAKGFLAGKQPLRWIGFDATTDELFSQSGDNVIYCLPGNKGSYWTPYYDLNKEFSSLADKYYTIFVDGHRINGYLYKEDSSLAEAVPQRDYDIFRLTPQTLDPNDAPYTIKSDANDEILYKLFAVNVDSRNLQKAVQIANLITNDEIKNAAINYALTHNSLPVAQRIQEAMDDDEESVYYKNKRIEKIKFIRVQPPPEPEQEENSDEEERRAAIAQRRKAQQEKKTVVEESEETKKKKSFFSQPPIKPKMDSEDELLEDLESAPTPKRKQTEKTKSSGKRKRTKKGADEDEEVEEETPKRKTKKAQRKKRGADDSADDEVEEVEETPKKKKAKKPQKKRRGADDSTESEEEPKQKGADDSTDEDEEQPPAKSKSKAKPKKKSRKSKGISKPEGVPDISRFGFTKK